MDDEIRIERQAESLQRAKLNPQLAILKSDIPTLSPRACQGDAFAVWQYYTLTNRMPMSWESVEPRYWDVDLLSAVFELDKFYRYSKAFELKGG